METLMIILQKSLDGQKVYVIKYDLQHKSSLSFLSPILDGSAFPQLHWSLIPEECLSQDHNEFLHFIVFLFKQQKSYLMYGIISSSEFRAKWW